MNYLIMGLAFLLSVLIVFFIIVSTHADESFYEKHQRQLREELYDSFK